MSPMTTATEMYQKYQEAEIAILQGQSVKFGERWLTRANLLEVQKGRLEWERKAASESRLSIPGGSSIRFQTPDFS